MMKTKTNNEINLINDFYKFILHLTEPDPKSLTRAPLRAS